MGSLESSIQISAEEAVRLGSVDGSLFGRFFFPRAFKQESPACHREMDRLLDDEDAHFVSFMLPRGWAKTTKTRVYIARRIAYGISRTIMIVGKSQDAAVKTLEWIKRAVEHNHRYANTFALQPGSRWSGADIEIIHNQFLDENGGPLRIRILAYGMTGSVRGVNIDDMRPDLIVIDDPCHQRGTKMLYKGQWICVEDHPKARKGKIRSGKKVRLDGLPLPEVVTVDHKYWAAKAIYEKSAETNWNKVYKGLAEPTWVEAQDLTNEHYIATPVNHNAVVPEGDLPFHKDAFWYLIGLWWGDGDLSGNGNGVRFSVSSKEVATKIDWACQELGWNWSKPLIGQGCIRAQIGNSKLWRWLKPWSQGNSIKQPPQEVQDLPPHYLFQLMKGYIDADGCVNRENTGIRLASKYYEGLVTASHLLGKLGIRSTIRKGRKGGQQIICGRVVTACDQYELGFTDSANLFLDGVRKPKRDFTKTQLEAGCLWRKVKSIETVTSAEFIPLSTEDHTYVTAFGKSHNCDEENTATEEQRKKTADLFFGAIKNSLAPPSECPMTKMVLLQTVLNPLDLVSLCDKDRQWQSLRISCFDDNGQSTWPQRWSTAELKEQKQGYIDKGMLALWMREMESKTINDDLAAFNEKELRYWDEEENGVGGSMPEGGYTFLSVDPVPPPKDELNVKIKASHDNAVVSALRVVNGAVYIGEQYSCKSPDVTEFIGQIFLMAAVWKTKVVVCETVLFQRVLRWAIQQEMVRRREYLTVIPIEDKRSKPSRIRQEIKAYCSARQLYVSKDNTGFLGEYWGYPFVQHDDFLDSVAIGLMHINPHMLQASFIEGEYTEVIEEEERLLGDWRADL